MSKSLDNDHKLVVFLLEFLHFLEYGDLLSQLVDGLLLIGLLRSWRWEGGLRKETEGVSQVEVFIVFKQEGVTVKVKALDAVFLQDFLVLLLADLRSTEGLRIKLLPQLSVARN